MFHPKDDREIDPNIPLMETNGTAWTLAGPDSTEFHDDSAGQHDIEEEHDSDSAEGDSGLLDGRSPEFEHLQRRSLHVPKKP
ncbi:MAG: hypothetical protein ACR2OU_00830 [Thermomicrobiales bacterium]